MILSEKYLYKLYQIFMSKNNLRLEYLNNLHMISTYYKLILIVKNFNNFI
jgi:hypothetical protein